MRIPKSWVPIIATKITENVLEKDLVASKIDKDQLVSVSEEILLDELMVEDRLNDDVRDMLKQYEKEIDTKRMDYRKLFDMTKHKIVRERNIIL
ncbi:MAG: DUF507 family protein [Thermodesulfovibrionales bacterium]